MMSSGLAIPAFDADGYLPPGVHPATEAEIMFRFGTGNRRRRMLALRLRRWIELARMIGGRRLLVDGSFVTIKPEPKDVDAVLWVPPDFRHQVDRREPAAVILLETFQARRPADLFPAENQFVWDGWVAYFSRIRESDDRSKGLVEVML